MARNRPSLKEPKEERIAEVRRADELAMVLATLISEHGSGKLLITGLYGATADRCEVFVTRGKQQCDLGHEHDALVIELRTDICTG